MHLHTLFLPGDQVRLPGQCMAGAATFFPDLHCPDIHCPHMVRTWSGNSVVDHLLSRTSLSGHSCLDPCPRREPLHSVSAQPTTNQQQMRNIVRFFPGFPGVQGMGLRLRGFSQDFRGSRGWGSLCEVFSRISVGPGDGAQIVRFLPGFPFTPHFFL